MTLFFCLVWCLVIIAGGLEDVKWILPFLSTTIGGRNTLLPFTPSLTDITYRLLILFKLSLIYLCFVKWLGSCFIIDWAKYIFKAILVFSFSILFNSFFLLLTCNDLIDCKVFDGFLLELRLSLKMLSLISPSEIVSFYKRGLMLFLSCLNYNIFFFPTDIITS